MGGAFETPDCDPLASGCLLQRKLVPFLLRFTNRIWPGLTEFVPPMWQAEADTELTLSAWPATAVGQILFTMVKFC